MQDTGRQMKNASAKRADRSIMVHILFLLELPINFFFCLVFGMEMLDNQINV